MSGFGLTGSGNACDRVVQEAGMSDDFKGKVANIASRQMDRRGVLKGAAAAGLGAAAAGTGLRSVLAQDATPQATTAPVTPAADATRVTFWTTHSGTGFEALTKITNDFNTANADVFVEIVQRPAADVEDSSGLITAVRAGEGPDVYLLDRFIVAERAAQQLLTNLRPLQEAAGVPTDLNEAYIPFAAAEATYQGDAYALPFDTDVRALFYNRALLTAAGIDLAELDPANGPITFQRLDEIAAMIDVDDGTNFTQCGFVPYHGQGWHYTYGFSFGGTFFDYENCEVTPDNEGVVAGAQWVQDYCNSRGADKLFSFVQSSRVPGSPPTENPFLQGRLGFMISGNWEFASFARNAPDLDYGYTYIPVPNAGDEAATWAGGWSGVIPAEAKEPDAAFRFLQYLCGPDGQRTYYLGESNIPTIKEVQADKSLYTEEMLFFIDNLLPITKFRPPIPVGAKYWSELTAAWEAIFLNQAQPAEAYAQVKENTMADLEAGGFCPIEPPAE
jgi:multiple sugar transport system substrate-binding protein